MQLDVINGQITQHFNIKEFMCSDGGKVYISPDFLLFVQCLEDLRAWYKRPVTITSGYRTPAHNKKVGGSSNSLHLIGQAIDFRFPAEYPTATPARRSEIENNIKNKWWQICKARGVLPHMGIYKTHFHIGISREKEFFRDWR